MPLYITERNRAAQRKAADVLQSRGWRIVHHHDLQAWDLTALMDGSPPVRVEVKERPWGAYKDIFLDKAKADIIVEGGHVGLFVVVPEDGAMPLWAAWLTAQRLRGFALDTRPVQASRHDPNDANDTKYLVPVAMFHPLYRGDGR